MSWSRRASLTALLAATAGCGFKPVYGRRGGDEGIRDELAAVVLPDADTRLAFELRSALAAQLDPGRLDVVPLYRLDWLLATAVEDLAIQPDATVTRKELTLALSYALVDLETGLAVDRGRVQRKASFNITDNPYNDRIARQDADRRVAEAVAVGLRQRLVAHFEQAPA